MANPAGSFIWYELATPDPDGSKAFYDAVVGWNIDAQPPGEMDYRMIGRADGGHAGGVMRISDEMRQNGASPMWLGYVYTPDVDAVAAAIEQAGGKIMMPANDIPPGRIAMVADPQGAPIYLMRPNPPPGAENQASDVFSVDQPQHIRWNELVTSDPVTAAAFYCDTFGWSQPGEMDMGPMGKYLFINLGETGIGAVMKTFADGQPSRWGYYIGVDDIDRAMNAVAAGGGTIHNGPHQIPGGEYTAQGVDPQGAAFGIVGPRRS